MDEFIGKSLKLQTQLVATASAFGSFLDSAQKIADRAIDSKGKFLKDVCNKMKVYLKKDPAQTLPFVSNAL